MANKLVEGAAETFDAVLGNLGKVTDTYLDLEKIIPSVSDLFVDQAGEIRKLNKELGSGSKLTTEFRSEIAKLSRDLGVSARDTIELVRSTKEYHQGIVASTEATLKFSKASGVSTSILGKFSAQLNILGKVSKETHERMYENILAVREAYGLTDNQIDNIIDSLTNYAIVTQASDAQMERATKTLSKFTSQLTSAGIEADKVAEIINDMIDPDRLADNLVLMSKMGITVNDMIAGDPLEKIEASTQKLKELGQEIANIAKSNRFQANEMAKIYGLTLEQAIDLSNIDTSEKALNTQKKLDEYRNEITTLVESMEAFKERISGSIATIINPILKGFEKLESSLGIFNKGLTAAILLLGGKWLINKLRSGIGNLFGEAARKFAKTAMTEYLSLTGKRSGLKAADIAALSPKTQAGSSFDYGWGKNYKVEAERRRDEYNRTHINQKTMPSLEQGELFETLQSRRNSVAEMEKQAAYMSASEKSAYNEKYGAEFAMIEKSFGDLLNTIDEKLKVGWGQTFLIDKEKAAGTEESFNIYKQALKGFGINEGVIGNFDPYKKETNDAIGKIFLDSKGPTEFLNALETFWKDSKDPEAAQNLDNVIQAQKKYNDELLKQVDTQGKATEIIQRYDKALEGNGGLGVKGRLGSVFRGLVTNLGTTFKQLPGKLLDGLKKGLKFGFLGFLGGVGVKMISTLSKNEKFQESISKVTERIGKIFDDIVKTVEPLIEPVSNIILGALSWIQPVIDYLTKILAKGVSWITGKLDKNVSSISSNVSAIGDSYKDEDLSTMIGFQSSAYDKQSGMLYTAVNNVVYAIDTMNKNLGNKMDTQTEMNIVRNNG